jgi:ribosomal protein S27AE
MDGEVLSSLVPSRKKIDLQKVLSSLNTICPSCGYSISPAEIVRIDFERQKCPKCGEVFAVKSVTARKTDQ